MKLHHIHIGKCAGSSINKVLNKNGFRFEEYHCFDADKEISNLLEKPRADDYFVISLRDPIKRFISAFNWEVYEKVIGDKPLMPKWKAVFDTFGSVNELAESLSENNENSALANYAIFESKLHLHLGIAWYLKPEQVRLLPKDRTVVVRTERFKEDMQSLAIKLGKQDFDYSGANSKDSKKFIDELPIKDPKFLSELGINNLKAALKADYDVLHELKKHGLLRLRSAKS